MLRPYLQGYKVFVKTNYPIKQVLKKANLAGRMVSWAVELLVHDIQYVPRGSIKSHIMAYSSGGIQLPNRQGGTLRMDAII